MKENEKTKDRLSVASADRILALLISMDEKLFGEQAKASVTDYIRLLQLYQELKEDEPKEICVRWVESTPSTER